MKRKIYLYKAIILSFSVSLLLLIHSCNDDEKVYEEVRLFMPVLNDQLTSEYNSIIVDLGDMKKAVGYFVEVSRDSFLTLEYSFNIDTNYIVVNEELTGEELLWHTVYQVRITSLADDPQYNSLPSFLGSVRTEKFPSNMIAPDEFSVTDIRALVKWIPSGEAITKIKVFEPTDERLTTPLLEFDVQADETELIIDGLNPSSDYQVAIYSNSTIRGWELYHTREKLDLGDNVLDIAVVDDTADLATLLADVDDGCYVILGGGYTYKTGGYEFDKSITFISGYSFVPALPKIMINTSFGLKEGSNVGYVNFKEVELYSEYNMEDGFVFNIETSGSIEEINFESCEIHNMYGITRMGDGTGTLGKFTVDGCMIDSLGARGVFSIDGIETWVCPEIVIQNSTISKSGRFLSSASATSSILIDGCTISECPQTGGVMFYWTGTEKQIDELVISNTLWGHGWDFAGSEAYDFYGQLYTTITTTVVNNVYTPNDFLWKHEGTAITGFPSVTYEGAATDLWEDPYNGDFNIKDSDFAGKSDSGDPRWRIVL